MTRAKAIKSKCLECSAESTTSVRCCPVIRCALWEYRFGRALRGGYKNAFLDKDFFREYLDMPQEAFNRLLLAEAHQRGKKGESETDGNR